LAGVYRVLQRLLSTRVRQRLRLLLLLQPRLLFATQSSKQLRAGLLR
jgi:hypothetical protein